MTVPPHLPTNLRLLSCPPQAPGPGSALSPKGRRVQANRKVHRLFNGVMATSLLRPDLIMTAASRVLGGGGQVQGGQWPCSDWDRMREVLHSVWHVNILQWLPRGGGASLCPPPHAHQGSSLELRRLSKPGPREELGSGEPKCLGHGPSPAPSWCTVQLGTEGVFCSGVSSPASEPVTLAVVMGKCWRGAVVIVYDTLL